MSGINSFILLLSATMMSGSSQSGEKPIRLVTQDIANGVRLQVIGDADAPVEASYSLEVTGGAGSNRSVQRGTARLQPGVPATLVTLTLGNGDAGWSATLTVSPKKGAPYEQTASSAAAM